MKRLLIFCLIVVAMGTSVAIMKGAESGNAKLGKRTLAPAGILGVPVSTMLNINRVAAWYSANGEQERIPSTGNSGLYYPRGTSTAIYSAGLIWGGTFNDGRTPTIRVNGQSYNNGTKPGAILGLRTGIAEDPNADDVRIWRIRRDYATADLRRDAAEINQVGISNVTAAQITVVREQYAKDWREWPWEKGAPFYDKGYLAANGLDTTGRNNGQLDWGEDVNRNASLDAGEDANNNGILDGEAPGLADADQVVWYVCNDIGVAQPWTCPESGLEEQTTIWGYARTDPIGNVIFKKFRLIYKGTGATPANATIDNMYLCQWSDPDLGDSGDDFAGCDTTLSLTYVYNFNPTDANYAQFGLVPPASGYDFLQGPLVDGVAGQDRNKNGVDDAQDHGIFNLVRVGPGKINLPMTSSMYFAAGGFYSDPPFSYNGAIQWYQMLRGLPPTPQGPPDPAPVINPTTGQPTPFWLSGDPVAGTGWLDGTLDNPGDRRILLTSGPFTMAVGDTQELVSAWVGGLGASNINSITVMKFNDRFVQTAYDSLFSLPKPPEKPHVEGVGLNDKILLDWGSDSASVARTEDVIVIGNYRFEGYKVYQLPDASGDLENARLIAKFDLVNGVKTISQPVLDPNSGEIIIAPVQYGTDNGISRTLTISQDVFRGRPFVTGQRYYFGVSAYNNTPDVDNPFKSYESTPSLITIVPETPPPGTRLPYAIGDTVSVRNSVGFNDAVVNPVIYNPTKQNGDVYTLRFDSTTTAGTFQWSLENATVGKTLYSNMLDLAGTTQFPVLESGFNLFVQAPEIGVHSVVNGNGQNVFGPNSVEATFQLLSSTGAMSGLSGPGRTGHTYELRFDGTGSFVARKGRPPFVAQGVYRAPFSVWDLGRTPTDTPRQVIAYAKWDLFAATRDSWSVDTAPDTIGGVIYRVFEAVGITNLSYPSGNDSLGVRAVVDAVISAGQNQNSAANAVYNILLTDRDGDQLPPPVGTTIRFNKFFQIEHGDTKSISPAAITVGDRELARKDVNAIKAFPNPYYGVNRSETDRISKFVTFNHLPPRATFRIFNLAGVLVRVMEKDDPPGGTTQFFTWDLQNSNGLPVASGIYVVYIEMPELGVTKTLKVAIIQEQQFLRFY